MAVEWASRDAELRVIELSWERRTIRVGLRSVHLTHTELAVCEVLLRNLGSWVSTRALMRLALGVSEPKDTSLIRVHVHAIRRKLRPAQACLRGERGQGYMLVEPSPGA
jgi:DNA-binding response OmpR family regulator